MKKIKKIFISSGSFILGLCSKVFAASLDRIEIKYGIIDPGMIEKKYGVFEPTIGEKISGIGKFAIPIILFVIGLFVVLSKKITKKVKIIIISVLIILVILGYTLMDYIAINF